MENQWDISYDEWLQEAIADGWDDANREDWYDENEAKRLGEISERSQTVKYADLIDNTSSIVKHDQEFAKTYLKEKKRIIELMTNGNKELFDFCKQQLSDLVLW